jgi:hypothetical protein
MVSTRRRNLSTSNIDAKLIACSRLRNLDLLVIDCRAATTDLFIDFFDEVRLAEVLRSLDATWGGLCIDDKGIYWETLSEMARHFRREDDLILLQVRPEDVGLHWQPKHTYNFTSDRSIPYNTFAKAVVDTAGSLGQAGDKGFFRSQAQIHIAAALETLREIGADVTLENAYHLLLDQGDLDEAMTDLASSHQTARRRELSEHFANRFLSQPPEQIGGVKETIANHLQAFITPDISQVFCPGGNTFDFADIDRGKIICVAMPQKFPLERRYVTHSSKCFSTRMLSVASTNRLRIAAATICSFCGRTKRNDSSPQARRE